MQGAAARWSSKIRVEDEALVTMEQEITPLRVCWKNRQGQKYLRNVKDNMVIMMFYGFFVFAFLLIKPSFSAICKSFKLIFTKKRQKWLIMPKTK